MKKKTIALLFTSSLMATSLLIGCNNANNKKGFTIKWVDYDQTVLEVDENVEEGVIPTYDSPVPTRASSESSTFVFTGFTPKVIPAYEDATYTATYNEIKRAFTVTWLNYDDTVLEVDNNVPLNQKPQYNGETPTKPKTDQYTYTFAGWDKDINEPVKNDITFTALFSHTTNKYNVTWENEGTVLKVDELEYGETPVYQGEEPEKASTDKLSFTFSGWSPEIVTVTKDVTYYAQFESSPRKYSIKIYDNEKLYSKELYEYGSPVTAPSGTFRTFYNILGFNTKIGGVWSDELLTSIPNAIADAEYRIVKELVTENDILLTELNEEEDLAGSDWDYSTGNPQSLIKENVNDVPTGATLSNKEQSVRVGTRNGIATIKIGSDLFYAIKNNAFLDTDYIQVYANFPVYAGGSKYNDVGLLLCKGQSFSGGGQYYGFPRTAPIDNTGSAVYYNGSTYWIKQVIANGGWQQLKIYVSELKAMLAGVPETNETEFDSIVLNGIRNAASPSNSTCPREITLYDVEFHRVDISKDFIINDCTNLTQIKPVTGTNHTSSDNNAVGLYDTTVPTSANGVEYPITTPVSSLKKGDTALSFITGTTSWEAQCALDISFIVDNIDKFADTDKIVVYAYGFNNYGDWLAIGGVLETNANGGGIRMFQDDGTHTVSTNGSGKHGAFNEATITIAQLKSLVALSSAYTSSSYTHDAICKTNWLNYHVKAAAAGTTNLIYSVELHHAS